MLHLLAKELFLEMGTFEIPPYRFKKSRSLKNGEQVAHQEALLKGGTVRVDRVTLEADKGAFTPDVEITSGRKTLLIEIAVTHKVDRAKLRHIRRYDIPALEIRLSVEDALLDRAELKEKLQQGLADKHWIFHPKQREAERRFVEKYRLRLRALRRGSRSVPWPRRSPVQRAQQRAPMPRSAGAKADWITYDRVGDQFYRAFGRYPSIDEAIARWPWLFNTTTARQGTVVSPQPTKASGSQMMTSDADMAEFKAVFEAALRLCEGNRDWAQTWLEEPAQALGGISPKAAVAAGRHQDVLDLIHRIESGVLS